MPPLQQEIVDIAAIVALHPTGITHQALMDELTTQGKEKHKPFVKTAKRAGEIVGKTIQQNEGEKPVLIYYPKGT